MIRGRTGAFTPVIKKSCRRFYPELTCIAVIFAAMISVVCATSRVNSFSGKVAEKYLELLRERNMEAQLFTLEDIPVETYTDQVYRKGEHALRTYGHRIFRSAERFVLVVPEYNASIPGIFKMLLDSCEPDIFKGKKFALVGVASGRGGNLRGMEHLTEILHYLQAEVYSFKQPISQIRHLVNESRELTDEATIRVMERQISGFERF